MKTFVINRTHGQADDGETTVEAVKYRLEGDYFVFSADASQTKKVLTIKASTVSTIETDLTDNKSTVRSTRRMGD